jgi:hypothetical protein
MGTLYVAKSKALQKWSADVGLTKHVYKLGITDGAAEDVVKALNDAVFAGERDWRLVKKQDAGDIDETTALERLGRKEKMIDPAYYPKIKGARGLFKAKFSSVQTQLLVRRAFEGGEDISAKAKMADVVAYLIANALEA